MSSTLASSRAPHPRRAGAHLSARSGQQCPTSERMGARRRTARAAATAAAMAPLPEPSASGPCPASVGCAAASEPSAA